MKPGRNDPCRCGSGKKYKKCCLEKDAPQPSAAELALEATRRAADSLPGRLIRYAGRVLGEDGLVEAWEDFNFEVGLAFDGYSVHREVFYPWYVYDWRPHQDDTAIPPGPAHDHGVAGAFFREAREKLDPLQQSYLQACIDAPFSFHEIVTCDPGRGFLLRDLLTGEEAAVSEHSGSLDAEPGLFLYGKVVRVNGCALLDGCSSYYFEPVRMKPVLDLRKELHGRAGRVDRGVVDEFAEEIRELYLDLVDEQLDPAEPQLENADGDPDEHLDLIDALKGTPAARAKMLEVFECQFKTWPDEPLRVLGDKTPREAIREPGGRELVEKLLADFASGIEEAGLPPINGLVAKVRESLGLMALAPAGLPDDAGEK